MALDHGILNVPLDKRGNIDREIDRWKEQQRKEKKAKASADHADWKARAKEAKAYVAEMPQDQLQRIATKAGLTLIQARKKLNSIAHWTPDQILRLKAGSSLPKT